MPNGQYRVFYPPPPPPGRRNHEDATGRNAVVPERPTADRLRTCKLGGLSLQGAAGRAGDPGAQLFDSHNHADPRQQDRDVAQEKAGHPARSRGFSPGYSLPLALRNSKSSSQVRKYQTI
jgi:hypothetical protein